MRELGVRLFQQQGDIDVRHIEGKKNIADLFTKEIKDSQHFRNMAFTITTPRLVANLISQSSSPSVGIKGGVEQSACWTKVMTASWIPSGLRRSLGSIRRLPTVLLGSRGLY
jgi:hypothetical protein